MSSIPNIDKEIIEFVKYLKRLEFEEEPDYEYLRSLLRDMLERRCADYRNENIKTTALDWNIRAIIIEKHGDLLQNLAVNQNKNLFNDDGTL